MLINNKNQNRLMIYLLWTSKRTKLKMNKIKSKTQKNKWLEKICRTKQVIEKVLNYLILKNSKQYDLLEEILLMVFLHKI